MFYLLDTNAISALMREDTRMAAWLSSLLVDDRAVINTITRGEILFGLGRLAQGRRRTELEAKAQKLFAALPCEPIPPAAGDLYARLKMALDRCNLLAINATLVIRDSDFQGIEGTAEADDPKECNCFPEGRVSERRRCVVRFSIFLFSAKTSKNAPEGCRYEMSLLIRSFSERMTAAGRIATNPRYWMNRSPILFFS